MGIGNVCGGGGVGIGFGRIPNPPQSNSDCKHGNKFDTTSYKLITNYPWSLWNIAVLSDLESCN